MNKKITLIVLALLIIVLIYFVVTADTKKDTKNTHIVTSFYTMYIATINLTDGLENVEVENLISSSAGCVHDYTLTPQEMVSLSHADVVVINGNGMEDFLDNITKNYNDLKIIDTSYGVKTIAEDEHGTNPHTFINIENYIIQVKNLMDSLTREFPQYSDKIISNGQKYISKLNEIKDDAISKLAKFSNTKVVALHETFEYFGDEFGLNTVAVIEEDENTAASGSHIANIIEIIKKDNIKVVISDSEYNSNIVNTIVNETGVRVAKFDNVTSGENNKDAYINSMRKNIDNISTSLGGE